MVCTVGRGTLCSCSETMEPPEDFLFPFSPYCIQKDFMKNLYSCLENGNLGIFESPTGTGKTLSIICGALKWLVDHENWQKSKLVEEIAELDIKLKKASDGATSDWFSIQTDRLKLDAERRSLQMKLEMIVKNEEKREKFKNVVERSKETKKKYRSKPVIDKNTKSHDVEESQIFRVDSCNDSMDNDLLLEDVCVQSDSSDEEDMEEELLGGTKIYFCSRTHSQLSQFINELKRSPYGDKISLVPLASRHSYCVNKEVRRLKHINLINERCLQFQRKRTTKKQEKDLKRSKASASCPYILGDRQLFNAEILTRVQDVEEISRRAAELETCAYYSCRSSARDSQVVVVPYNTILHRNTRISSGIVLRGNVLIIDEAHNLLEAVERMYSAAITGRNLLHCVSQLSQYQNRYQALFSARNLLRLNQLNFCMKKLAKVLGGSSKSCPDDRTNGPASPKLYRIEDFEAVAEIDTVNIFELVDFVKSSKLTHKLQGYMEKYSGDLMIRDVKSTKSGVKAFLDSLRANDSPRGYECEATEQFEDKSTNNPLLPILAFLECMKTSCSDGRIFVTPGPTVGQGILKFLLLNPAAQFRDIVKDARAVILAGGTMQPISEFREQLFINSGAEPERIVTFSCDHIIPKENILTNVLTRGPNGMELEFNFQNRENTGLLNEIGSILTNVCNIVPGGIVVFLPSYSYEATLYNHLEASGVIKRINARKSVFREPKAAFQVNHILEQYAQAAKNPQRPKTGSLLFSVVGGKLSEGLNFSDDLGRCVMVVGMPYPNVKSPELQEKMRYLNENVNLDAGRTFYENACMKAVNQCIGRAVRHINDYSTVILIDKRYANKTQSLPAWIQRTLRVNDSFGPAIGTIAKFFLDKSKSAALKPS